jgi:tripartite-type tricarboxylate transporter receptor subunit TctC
MSAPGERLPYRSGALALTDLIGGQVEVYFDAVPSSIEYIRAGKLRPLAVTTATRWEGLPDLPTVGDFVPGYEASAMISLFSTSMMATGVFLGAPTPNHPIFANAHESFVPS